MSSHAFACGRIACRLLTSILRKSCAGEARFGAFAGASLTAFSWLPEDEFFRRGGTSDAGAGGRVKGGDGDSAHAESEAHVPLAAGICMCSDIKPVTT